MDFKRCPHQPAVVCTVRVPEPLLSIRVNRCSLARQIVFDGITEASIDDVVRRPGECGLKSSTDLVLALRTRLEPRNAVLDAELDSLVIARLEMQAVVVCRGAPVAAEQGLL